MRFAAAKRRLPGLLRFVRRTKIALAHGGKKREREMRLLPFLVPRNRSAVDVGANIGIYTDALVGLCSQLVAIEPNPCWAAQLSAMYKRVRVIEGAASNALGRTTLRIPTELADSGMATIEPENSLTGQTIETVTVDVITIDSLGLNDVGFIKIDVEGHEEAVLEGASHTIRNCRPNLLIESEERHRPGSVFSTARRLNALGYKGYMLWNGALTPVSEFRPAIHQAQSQSATRPYVNNFVFLPD